PANATHQRLFFDHATALPHAGAKVDATDPLAVLHHGKTGSQVPASSDAPDAATRSQPSDIVGPENTVAIMAPLQGTIVSIDVREGDLVHRGQQLLIMEAMKMEHVIQAETSGVVRRLVVVEGDTIFEGHPLAFIEEVGVEVAETERAEQVVLDAVRADLADVHQRHALTLDAGRPAAGPRRRPTG